MEKRSTVLKNNNYFLTIVVTNYNKMPYLEYLVKYFKDYYHNEHIEIIFIDDSSTDGSIDILKTLSETENVRVLKNSRNSGIGSVRNHGLREAHGKYITFVDGDDILMDNYGYELFSYVVRYGIYAEKKVDVFNFLLMSYPDGGIITNDKDLVINKVYRKEFLEKHKLKFPSARAGEDVEFNELVFAKNPKIYNIPKVLYLHNKISDGLSHTSVLKMEENNNEKTIKTA